MSGDRVFLDTNIIVYMYDTSEPMKKEISLSLLDANDCVISTQVINEISNVLTRKVKVPINEVRQVLKDAYRVCDVKKIHKKTIFYTFDLMERYRFSYFDCLMLASALDSGCNILFSEDMNDGQVIESNLKIVNPYKTP